MFWWFLFLIAIQATNQKRGISASKPVIDIPVVYQLLDVSERIAYFSLKTYSVENLLSILKQQKMMTLIALQDKELFPKIPKLLAVASISGRNLAWLRFVYQHPMLVDWKGTDSNDFIMSRSRFTGFIHYFFQVKRKIVPIMVESDKLMHGVNSKFHVSAAALIIHYLLHHLNDLLDFTETQQKDILYPVLLWLLYNGFPGKALEFISIPLSKHFFTQPAVFSIACMNNYVDIAKIGLQAFADFHENDLKVPLDSAMNYGHIEILDIVYPALEARLDLDSSLLVNAYSHTILAGSFSALQHLSHYPVLDSQVPVELKSSALVHFSVRLNQRAIEFFLGFYGDMIPQNYLNLALDHLLKPRYASTVRMLKSFVIRDEIINRISQKQLDDLFWYLLSQNDEELTRRFLSYTPTLLRISPKKIEKAYQKSSTRKNLYRILTEFPELLSRGRMDLDSKKPFWEWPWISRQN